MRWATASAMFLWLAPVLAVGAHGLGLPTAPAVAVGLVGAAAIAAPASRRLADSFRDARGVPRILGLALMVAAAVAIVRIAMLSVFIADVHRPHFSVDPSDAFRLPHSCMSAYAEAARFAREGDHNIYERELYRPGGVARQFGPLRADPFHYPPPFLLVPAALRTVAPDIFDFRRLWFTIQAVTFAGVLIGLGGWIGGRPGTLALLGGTIVIGLPHVAATLQQGNFQITAVALAILAFVLLVTRRRASGGGLLAYAALAKIFPGILAVPLLAARRWRDLGWLVAAGAVMLLLTVAALGTRPFGDFLGTSLPEIASGAAFPQTENPQHARVNFSVYGQTVRLRTLGVESLTQPRGLMMNQIYGGLVALLALWAGWRARFASADADARIALLLCVSGLVGLASFRSPFVGAVYGSISTLWILALFAARASTPAQSAGWMGAQVALAAVIWIIPSPAGPHSPTWVWISGAAFLACMAIHASAVVVPLRELRRAPLSAVATA